MGTDEDNGQVLPFPAKFRRDLGLAVAEASSSPGLVIVLAMLDHLPRDERVRVQDAVHEMAWRTGGATAMAASVLVAGVGSKRRLATRQPIARD